MAEGLLRHNAGGTFAVESAGLAPSFVRPEAIEVMRELGIDISDQRSKSIEDLKGKPFDYVITVCDNANQKCPIFPGASRRIHWSIEDPAAVEGTEKVRLAAFRAAREELRERLNKLIARTKKSSASG
jgi:arsenate reductase